MQCGGVGRAGHPLCPCHVRALMCGAPQPPSHCALFCFVSSFIAVSQCAINGPLTSPKAFLTCHAVGQMNCFPTSNPRLGQGPGHGHSVTFVHQTIACTLAEWTRMPIIGTLAQNSRKIMLLLRQKLGGGGELRQQLILLFWSSSEAAEGGRSASSVITWQGAGLLVTYAGGMCVPLMGKR